MKKIILLGFLSMALFSCKKDNTVDSKTSDHKQVVDQISKDILSSIKDYKNTQLQSSNKTNSEASVSKDSSFKEFLREKYGDLYIKKVFKPIQAKFNNIVLKIVTNGTANGTETLRVSNVALPDDFTIDDLSTVNDQVSNAMTQAYNPSVNVTNAMQSLNADIDTISVNYLRQRYQADSTDLNVDDGSTYINSISNALIAHTGYAQTVSMTDDERSAYCVALLSANDQIVNNVGPAFATQLMQVQAALKSKIRINGFFSWIKQNILAPVVTLVVKTTVFVGAVVGGAILGAALFVADWGEGAGMIAGIAAAFSVSNAVNKVLVGWGLYNPYADIANFDNI
ncbi:hypothetical protein BEL04_15170 [Mucilaginibacter sp. PPCGB 2223]|uniref:hypothetical protein n=1 Tax=Mucilaginibacter sp. PPCGB 2223 TaxID=1886027 RepID=UPI00082629C3|nr:hypothetical protein [Mucilaginibacter sp. PPCGB 2223]OCX51370.1 hypothetical protein BEL04_15170 [Mucilaginibacter sp. PPCGB 2223]